MSLFHRLDRWLIAGPYQWLIDVSGKKREWWIEHCAYAILMAGVGGAVLKEDYPAWVRYSLAGVVMLAALMVFLDSKVQALMEGTAQRHGLRVSLLAFVLLTTPLEFIKPVFFGVLGVVYSLGVVSSYYFAACQPPKPREPRRKLATVGSGA